MWVLAVLTIMAPRSVSSRITGSLLPKSIKDLELGMPKPNMASPHKCSLTDDRITALPSPNLE